MEIEGCNPVQPAPRIQVVHRGQRSNLVGSFDYCGTQTPAILDGRTQPSHQRTRVLAKALLAWYERIPVVGILDSAFFEIGRDTHIVMRSQNKTGSLTGKELSNCFYFLGRSFLLCNHVVQTKYHQRVRVFEQSLVKQLPLPRLVDPLVNRDRMPRNLTDERLKPQERQMKQLQGAGNPLQEHLFRIFHRLVVGPRYPA